MGDRITIIALVVVVVIKILNLISINKEEHYKRENMEKP